VLETSDIVARLTVALLIGCGIGLNRNLHGKPAGMRTLGLVAVGAALVVMVSGHGLGGGLGEGPVQVDAASRAIQGVLSGIGFLGAGVILRGTNADKVHGLTTAASVWVTACLGLTCGLGAWRLVVPATVLVGLVLAFGGPIEKWLHALDRRAGVKGDEDG
jgi:putative Mg2+ transporter-C (MgtC) family protein